MQKHKNYYYYYHLQLNGVGNDMVMC